MAVLSWLSFHSFPLIVFFFHSRPNLDHRCLVRYFSIYFKRSSAPLYTLSLKILGFFQTKMETVQVFIKSEDDELEESNVAQHTNPLKEETLFLEPLKSER
jgi:hypothetical protein